jgi:hypothetical protein
MSAETLVLILFGVMTLLLFGSAIFLERHYSGKVICGIEVDFIACMFGLMSIVVGVVTIIGTIACLLFY